VRKTENNKSIEILYDSMQFNLIRNQNMLINISMGTSNKLFEKLERIKWTQTHKLRKSTKYIQLQTH